MQQNLAQIFRSQAQKLGKRLAVEKRLNGVWQGITWEEYYENAKQVGLGLYSLGVRKGDRVSILSTNRLEWVISDMGILGIGAVTIPIYPTVPASEVGYINSNSDSLVYIAEEKSAVARGLETIKECPLLKKIVVEEIVDRVDHRNLNTDVDFLRDVIPTSENLVVCFWQLLEKRISETCELYEVRLWETENNVVFYRGEKEEVVRHGMQ
mgnify:CR=1 FL=1